MQPTNPQPYAPTPPAPQPAPQAAPQPTPQPAPQASKPGKTIGIVGFIFAFIWLHIPGLILSIISFNKAKRAGIGNGLALAGIILNSLGILVSLIVVPMVISTTLVSYNAVSLRASTAASKATASTAIEQSKLYYSSNGTYPTTLEAIASAESLADAKASPVMITSEPATVSTIEFQHCGSDGNKVGYWNYEDKEVIYLYSGTASQLSTCVLSTK